jgi:E3 ubiquitin-protein ligase DOA10
MSLNLFVLISVTIVVTAVDDNPAVCRICRDDESTDALISPCDCSGSMAHVHFECLRNWVRRRPRSLFDHQQISQCEVCLSTFQGVRVVELKPFLIGFAAFVAKFVAQLFKQQPYEMFAHVVRIHVLAYVTGFLIQSLKEKFSEKSIVQVIVETAALITVYTVYFFDLTEIVENVLILYDVYSMAGGTIDLVPEVI